MPLDSIETLQELIRIASVNPMGRELTGPTLGEGRLTDYLQTLCETLGWPWLRQEVHPGRENLVALIRGDPSAAGRRRADSVGRPPRHRLGRRHDRRTVRRRSSRRSRLRPRCMRRQRLDGRHVAALSRLDVSDSKQTRPTIVIAFTVNEECGFTGATALCRLLERRIKRRHVGHNCTAGAFSPTARRRHRRRTDRSQCGRRAPGRRALAMPRRRSRRPLLAARRRHQRDLRHEPCRAGD